MNKKVSILMPCYNAEKYLDETLQCLLSQDYENIEIVIVDDGSTDNSYLLAFEYSKIHPQVKVYKQPNSGACAARNLAFEKSTGDYIMYMDADDLISHDQIAAQMEILGTVPDGYMVFGRWARFYDSVTHARVEAGDIYHDYNRAADALADMWNGKGMMPIHSYIIPRSIIGNERFNTSLRVNQDGEFLCRILMRAKGLKYCPKGVAFYRSGLAGSISAKKISHAKGESLLLASRLCKASIGCLVEDKYFAQGLARQFYGVAYLYQQYQDIVDAAHREIKQLSASFRNPGIGGTMFQQLCRLLGFWNVLKLKQSLKYKYVI